MVFSRCVTDRHTHSGSVDRLRVSCSSTLFSSRAAGRVAIVLVSGLVSLSVVEGVNGGRELLEGRALRGYRREGGILLSEQQLLPLPSLIRPLLSSRGQLAVTASRAVNSLLLLELLLYNRGGGSFSLLVIQSVAIVESVVEQPLMVILYLFSYYSRYYSRRGHMRTDG